MDTDRGADAQSRRGRSSPSGENGREMAEVLSLALPFFGLIFVGFLAGRFGRIPPDGLAGLNLFVVYFALPSMFFVLISRTPIEQISNWPFIIATTSSTLIIFAVGFAIAMTITRGRITESTIQGLGAAYGNVGYMAPGLTLAAFGPAASVPTALIFCFDNALVFTLAPLGKALGGRTPGGVGRLAVQIVFRILTRSFWRRSRASLLRRSSFGRLRRSKACSPC